MKTFNQLVSENSQQVTELMPWDLEKKLTQDKPPILLDVREVTEFTAMHIKGSVNVPRGILEIVCDLNNKNDAPELVNARNQEVIVICGSGKRSIMAASTMVEMGYVNATSLKTGLKGWNDYNLPLVNHQGDSVDPEQVGTFLSFNTTPQQFT